jgi:hypothetical protein
MTQKVEPNIQGKYVEKDPFKEMNFANKTKKSDFETQFQLSDPEHKKHYSDLLIKDKLSNLKMSKELSFDYDTTPEFILSSTSNRRTRKRYIALFITEMCGADPYNVIDPNKILKITDNLRNYINDYLGTYITPTFGYKKQYKLRNDYSYFCLIRKILRSALSLEIKWMYKGTFMFVADKNIRTIYEFVQSFRVDRRQEAREYLLSKYPVLQELGHSMLSNFSDPDFELTDDIADMWRLTEDHLHQYNDLIDNLDDCTLLTDAVSCPKFQDMINRARNGIHVTYPSMLS